MSPLLFLPYFLLVAMRTTFIKRCGGPLQRLGENQDLAETCSVDQTGPSKQVLGHYTTHYAMQMRSSLAV